MTTNNKIYPISISQIKPFEGQPYQVRDDAEMDALVESIKEHGILEPLKVRGLGENEGYELISGHRRLRAAQLAGMEKVPTIIYTMTREEAVVALVDSNLHREHILPSEKAFAYKMKMEALAKQGKRTDLTSDQLGPRLAAGEVSEEDSASQVKRYIRLTNLIPELLEYVDSGKIAMTPAVELSYLSPREQHDLWETMQSEDCTPSLSQAQQMKKASRAGDLPMDRIFAMMSRPKANQVEKISLKLKDIEGFFPKDYTPQQIETAIYAILVEHQKRLQRKHRDRDAR